MKPLRLLSASVTVIGLLVAADGGHAAQTPLVISTLSTAPDRVSGGDVLVQIDVPAS